MPEAAAGACGPCPKCSWAIVGPDPKRGRKARLVEVGSEGLGAAPEVVGPLDSPASGEGTVGGDGEVGDAASGQRDQPAPETGGRSSSAAVLFFSCLLSAALAFIGGYFAGQFAGSDGMPGPKSARSGGFGGGANPGVEKSGKVGDKTEKGGRGKEPRADQDGKTGSSEGTAPPGTVLKSFLEAPGWAARSAFVLFPGKIREAMAAHALVRRDAPIETIGVSLMQAGKDRHVYLVRTSAFPGGFPVAVVSTDGGWLVDWEIFIEFHDDMFKSFADGKAARHGVFHLLVNRVGAEAAPEDVALFELTPPMPGRKRLAWVRKDSAVDARLDEIFRNQEEVDPEAYGQLVASKGFPLVLSVSRRTDAAGAHLTIGDVLAVGWNSMPMQDR